jgi:Mn2+/Fe2+ NRAMP family transporter
MQLAGKFNKLGPGLLFAATAIGVSHLVQSTRAGAEYEYQLVWAIVLANLFKYPFFEFGTRYAAVKGKSIIDGYLDIGKWFLWIFLLINISTMFTVSAAVSFVAGGILQVIFPVITSIKITTTLVFLVCLLVLWKGKFSILEKGIKVMALIMFVTTIATFVLVLVQPDLPEIQKIQIPAQLPVIIALMGWMPTALDISSWSSLWTVEKMKDESITVSDAKFDFNFGYLITALLALVFLILGAKTLYPSSEVLADTAVGFAHQLLGIFTSSIGNWSFLIVAIAAFTIMFSTSLTVVDGYSRAVSHIVKLLGFLTFSEKSVYRFLLFLMVLISLVIVHFFGSSLSFMVGLATTISFVIAPIIAIANLYLVKNQDFPKSEQPKTWLFVLSIGGFIFLTGFSVVYLFTFK